MTVADEHSGRLSNRVIFFADEFGTIPKLEGAEMLFSAARSRGLTIVAIVQGLIQLDKNYGKEGAQIIRDNCQLTIFGGFAPGSETANTPLQGSGGADGPLRLGEQGKGQQLPQYADDGPPAYDSG